ncbi:MAG: hypothetical protein CVU51_01240 [Deltaproteobacteria bacterium HGW-Deltaproteobacteria-1]|jgi:ubiquinone/menaquinone biosynthesis C-methylase UbiE/uncharacterized protein YbaR (Trm112 family)|nr:MAG: hypothetical protein CVU51_01240 [Deltaproteobacteria bacterium HGW-Deltaproteobacteria-1]
MREDSINFLRCPNCKGQFGLNINKQTGDEIMQGILKCQACGECFDIKDGHANLIFPRDLDKSTLSIENFYDQRPLYDYRPTAFRFGIWSIAFQGTSDRIKWANRLAIHEGASVLEIGVGNGGNLPFIADVIGEKGLIHGLDISSVCIKIARERMMHRNTPTELVHGNATYLPYKDDAFDAILCVGGINDFSDKKRALQEINRVAKAGAKIVIEDEGLAPDREKTLLGKYILMCMKVFENKPPVMDLPEAVEDLKIDWIYQRTFWVMEYRKRA